MFAWFVRLWNSVFGNETPHIVWSRPEKRRLNWTVDQKTGKLIINGHVQDPHHPWLKTDLERSLGRLREKITASGHLIVIEAIYIEEHVAGGLWNEGTLTREMLEQATEEYKGLTVQLELLGETYPVSIQTGTYYENYEFIVRGHPNGDVRVRDIPDALAVYAGEMTF